MGRFSREKGKRGERDAAKAIETALGLNARRGVQYAGGNESPDVVADLPGVHFEVKRTERLALYDALEQAQKDAAPSAVPVVLHRRNLKPWVCVLEVGHIVPFVHAVASRLGWLPPTSTGEAPLKRDDTVESKESVSRRSCNACSAEAVSLGTYERTCVKNESGASRGVSQSDTGVAGPS